MISMLGLWPSSPTVESLCLLSEQPLHFNTGLSKATYEGKSSAPAKLKSDLNTFQHQVEMAFGLSVVADYSHYCSAVNKVIQSSSASQSQNHDWALLQVSYMHLRAHYHVSRVRKYGETPHQ